MKKILGIFLFICIAFKGIAQSGDGSSGNPFYGTISTNVNWSVGNPIYGSTVYVGRAANPDLTVTTGGHLTIDPGITVIFTQLTSDLIITGSGVLTSNGTISNNILFTKASSIAHWGHITFEIPGSTNPITGTGSFKYCKVEYGYANGIYPNPNSAGGGIQVSAPNVTIENCYFNNNYATFGGGVTVNTGQNTSVKNCYFKSNSANECAGALLLFLNASATVENCIFESNSCNGVSAAYYGGGAIWTRQNTSKIVNCTFVKNTSPRPGDALYSYNSPSSKIVNSIFWGSNDQFATTGTAALLAYCAFDTQKPATALNSIILNSNNSDPAGPNFVATDGSSWILKFISPCRDAGTNSYSGVTIPATDYLGKSTISTKDMGALEVQYSIWTGSVSDIWLNSANWEGNVGPAFGTGDVIIPSGLPRYPTGAPAKNFTIGAGNIMVLKPGAKATLSSLTNNGTLQIQSDATNLSTLIVSSYSGNDASLGLFLSGGLAGGPKTEKWHYISSPIASLPVSTFAPAYTLNVVGWYDSRVTTTLSQGWAAYDGYVYATGQMGGPTFNTLTPGLGYDYYDSADDQYTFAGQLNTNDVSVNLEYNVDDALHGFTLLGNPFSSGLDWDVIVNGGSYPANTNKSISYTRNNTECTYVAGVGNPSDVTGIIPPMQGFFVRTHSAGNTVNLASAARTHTGIHATYKKGLDIIPLVRLAFAEGTGSDETVVRFDNSASTNLDNDFDGIKMFISTTNTQIYSVLSGTNYAINGQPFPTDSIEIPVVVNLLTGGDHNISATQIQGLENYNLFLLDKTAGTVTNLKTNPTATFTSLAGKYTNRFALKIIRPTVITGSVGDPIPPVITPPIIGSDPPPVIGTDPPIIGSGPPVDTVPVLTAISDHVLLKGTFNIYPSFEFINIQTLADDWDRLTGSVRVLDLMGKPVSDLENAEFRRGEVIQVERPVTRGMYLVEIKSGVKRFVGKVMIR